MKTKTPISFRGFDELGEVRIYHNGILPHWRQDGCTYFVTFRQADALPLPVLRELEYERKLWLRSHGIDPEDPNWKNTFAQLPKADQRDYERRVGTRLDEFLDAGHGSCELARREIATVVARALEFFHNQRVLTGDFIVMPNHVHVLMTPLAGFELENVLHSIKSFTANEINRVLGKSGGFWQRESYDHIVRDFDQLCAYQRYIAANFVKARLNESQYLHSTAVYCADQL